MLTGIRRRVGTVTEMTEAAEMTAAGRGTVPTASGPRAERGGIVLDRGVKLPVRLHNAVHRDPNAGQGPEGPGQGGTDLNNRGDQGTVLAEKVPREPTGTKRQSSSRG